MFNYGTIIAKSTIRPPLPIPLPEGEGTLRQMIQLYLLTEQLQTLWNADFYKGMAVQLESWYQIADWSKHGLIG